METTIRITLVVLMLLLGGAAVAGIVIGVPGAWIIIAAAILVELTDGLWREDPSTPLFPLWLFAAAIVLALMGELLEFALGALGVRRGGGTRRGMIGAVIGGIGGAILGTFIPIPLVGTLIGAIAGTFVGAFIFELGDPALRTGAALRPALWATLGRIAGSACKIPIAATILMGFAVALLLD